MPKQREFEVEWTKSRFHFEQPDGGYCVIGVGRDANGIEHTIKGEVDSEGTLKPGLTYCFYGYTQHHWKHGEQFNFTSFVIAEPATEQAVTTYLRTQCHGIGPATAAILWDRFGPDAVRRLRETPEDCVTKRFRLEMAQEAARTLQANHRIERAKIDLMGLLDGRGFPRKTIDRAIEQYGSRAAAMIRHNPYLLMRFRGCGFLGTDKMYLDLGGKPGRLKRQSLCAWYSLASDSDGHTWYHLGHAAGAIQGAVGGADVNFDRALQLCLRSGMLTDRDGGWIAETRKAWSESQVAEYAFQSLAEEPQWPNALNCEGLSEHQAAELHLATQGPIGVLCGSPGTGKTHTAGALLRLVESEFGAFSFAACAPTGKAAVRLSESLRSHGVNVEATTIHALLRVQSVDGGFCFVHCEAEPLPYRFVLIDEASMIDTDLMRSLLAARAVGTQMLFLGDTNQLAPVGHGAPLRDIIKAGLPCGELVEIRRNSGTIVELCAAIRDRKPLSVPNRFDFDSNQNLMLLPSPNPEQQIDSLLKFLQQIKAKDGDPVWDCQILVAVNDRSPLSRKLLNQRLQGVLNPDGETAKGNPFRVSDKVICLKNGKYPRLDDDGDPDETAVLVCNGEQGEVVAVEPARTIVRMSSPDRVVVVPHGQKGADETDSGDSGAAGNWDLGYAISCHKSQGSEWPWVVVMLDEYGGARRLCSRNWIYTAISRAKQGCLLIGKQAILNEMARRDGLQRRTFLAELIAEKRAECEAALTRMSDTEINGLFMEMAGCCDQTVSL